VQERVSADFQDICKFLLENGCDVNARNAVGWTPLFFAAEGLHKRVAQVRE